MFIGGKRELKGVLSDAPVVLARAAYQKEGIERRPRWDQRRGRKHTSPKEGIERYYHPLYTYGGLNKPKRGNWKKVDKWLPPLLLAIKPKRGNWKLSFFPWIKLTHDPQAQKRELKVTKSNLLHFTLDTSSPKEGIERLHFHKFLVLNQVLKPKRGNWKSPSSSSSSPISHWQAQKRELKGYTIRKTKDGWAVFKPKRGNWKRWRIVLRFPALAIQAQKRELKAAASSSYVNIKKKQAQKRELKAYRSLWLRW